MKKNGFTLIELLAVIIILGILMIIAIPSVTKYISDSRKSAYIKTAKQVVSGTRNIVNDGKLEMYDTNTVYYIPNSCVRTENGGKAKSPYGEFTRAYVVVTYDGKGYNYFWTSVDEAREGIPEIISVDELIEDDIKSDVKLEDIKNNFGIAGRKQASILDENDCNSFRIVDAIIDVICKRAEILHTEECGNGLGCKNLGYTLDGIHGSKTITYGNLGTKGQLNPGDAFDCDVNDDGVFDKNTERFYFLTKNGNIGSFIYYINTYNGQTSESASATTSYSSLADIQEVDSEVTNADNLHGPVTGYKHLPSTSTWKNPKLIVNQTRSITNENGTKTTEVGTIISTFTYNEKSARMPTYQELESACKSDISGQGGLDNCLFVFENTIFRNSGLSNSYWLETPRGSRLNYIWYVEPNFRYVVGTTPNGNGGIRPVIDVKLSDVDY